MTRYYQDHYINNKGKLISKLKNQESSGTEQVAGFFGVGVELTFEIQVKDSKCTKIKPDFDELLLIIYTDNKSLSNEIGEPLDGTSEFYEHKFSQAYIHYLSHSKTNSPFDKIYFLCNGASPWLLELGENSKFITTPNDTH